MFEGFTLEQQRRIELERGWKPTYSALTYCTAEAVLFRGEGPFINREILIAERTSGAPDCLGKTQGKWGTYVKPTDRNARYALQRGLKELFGWEMVPDNFRFVGIIGPELFKSRISLDDGVNLVLEVTNEQAEKTPFEAKLFVVDASNREIVTNAPCHKSTSNVRWVTLRKLIDTHGQNPDFLYWTMAYMSVATPSMIAEFAPGNYRVATTPIDPDENRMSGAFGTWPPGAP